ncbi:MAG TPA: efflux RND transporter periplasmic adaptor subunit [Blastocatellia bacterium]|jgi:multidrug efflux pump subunit AcrA (membrane-fusion protein)|nr:efflux RND transporter periplasmic adaptor subunit [Blastocatellia bacterium]
MNRHTVGLLSALAIALLSSACGRRQEAAKGIAGQIPRVKIESVVAAPIEDFHDATGTVRSKTTSAVSSRIMGSIISINTHEGHRVRRGQILIEIDTRDANVQLQRAQAGMREAENALEETERNLQAAGSGKAAAEASLALATATYNRYQTLFERRSVSPQEFDEVQAKYKVAGAEAERAARILSSMAARKNQVLAKIDQAKADVVNARVNASYGRVASPIDGIVTAKHAEVGAMAVPGSPLLTIEDDSHYRLEASVEESLIRTILAGDRVGVRIDALGDEELSGTISEIAPAADPASRTYMVKIDLPSLPSLRSGSFGKARFSSGQKQAITIPQRAIAEWGQMVGVFVVDDSSIARLRLVRTGKSFGDRVEVLTGLSDGERIVIDPVKAVTDGTRIEPL